MILNHLSDNEDPLILPLAATSVFEDGSNKGRLSISLAIPFRQAAAEM